MSNIFFADLSHGSVELFKIEEPVFLDILWGNFSDFFAVILVDKNFLLDHSSLVLDHTGCKCGNEEDSSILQNLDGNSAIAELQDLIISNDSSSEVVIDPSEEVKDKLDIADALITDDISEEESAVAPVEQEEIADDVDSESDMKEAETADVIESVSNDISEEESAVAAVEQEEIADDVDSESDMKEAETADVIESVSNDISEEESPVAAVEQEEIADDVDSESDMKEAETADVIESVSNDIPEEESAVAAVEQKELTSDLV